ncbi:MAG: beta-phosphoglucomutase [Bacteroidia bacterium]
MIKAIIFDLDGVLVDTAKFHFVAWKKLAKDLGTDISEAQNEQLKGVSRVDSLERIIEWGNLQISDQEKEAALISKNAHYLELCDQLSPEDLLPGVREFLTEIGEKGLHVAVGSASKNANLILRKLGISTFLDTLIDGNMTTKGKPDPQVFLMAAEQMHVEPWQAIVFEDAPKGVDAAKAGGFNSVGVGSYNVLGHANLVIPGFKDINLNTILKQFED